MAHGTDVEEEEEKFVVLSKVRAGHKREFAFALKSQNEVAACLGRTRVRKRVNEVSERVGVTSSSSPDNPRKSDAVGLRAAVMDGVGEGSGGMDCKGEGMEGRVEMESEEEPKSDVLDITSDDDNRSHSVESRRKDAEADAGMAKVTGRDRDSDGTNAGREEVLERGMGEGDESLGIGGVSCSGKRTRDGAGGAATAELPLKRFTQSTWDPSLMETDKHDSGGKLRGDNAGASTAAGDNVGNVSIKMIPTKLRDLLGTGLLEGLNVRYMRSVKTRASGDLGLRGVISGIGIMCYCDDCQGTKVVSPNLYEQHAGSSNKRPADYTYLENGNSFRDILNACNSATMDDLEVIIRHSSRCVSAKNSTFCANCKGSGSEANLGQSTPLSNLSLDVKVKEETQSLAKSNYDGLVEAGVAKKSSDSMAKLRASGTKGQVRVASGTKGQGRVTRKDLRLHKLVFDEDVLPDGTEVGYYTRGKKLLSGYKRGNGIYCLCCQEEISPSQFEAHAGCSSRRKPYLHIYTSNGVSLHELSISLSRTRESSTDENDDLCGICFDAGELLCCDGCPRAFHAECISVQTIPLGKWYCRYCVNIFEKKLFKHNADAIAAGRVDGVDPIEQISSRCIRIVQTLDSDSSCCMLCRGHDFSRTGFGPTTVIICDQCEKEYHVGCLRSHMIQDLKELPQGKWFCSSDCSRIHAALQQMIKTGEQEIPDSLLDVVNIKQERSAEFCNLQIRWRLLSGKFSSMDEMRLLLSKTVTVFHEQFDPILNPNSTQDLIPHMVYGRDMKDRELGGMYCAILSVNSIIVSALIFRIFGNEAAEIPLVATSSYFQRKGYFQTLYACIESLFRDLGVKNLMLPAAEEARSLWTNKFGFSAMKQDELNDLMTRYNVMTFSGTSMLHKLVPRL